MDHLAIAVEHWSDAWPLFARELGGRWAGCGYGDGYAPMQLTFGADRRLELIAPHGEGVIRRFLDHNGPGPQHLTFEVPRFAAATASIEAAGLVIKAAARVNGRQQAFIGREQSGGIVVQIVDKRPTETMPRPAGFTDPDGASAALRGIVLVVGSLTAPRRLYETLLGGTATGERTTEEARVVDLQWADSPTLRLLEPGAGHPLWADLRDRRGIVSQLVFEGPGVRPQETQFGVEIVDPTHPSLYGGPLGSRGAG